VLPNLSGNLIFPKSGKRCFWSVSKYIYIYIYIWLDKSLHKFTISLSNNPLSEKKYFFLKSAGRNHLVASTNRVFRGHELPGQIYNLEVGWRFFYFVFRRMGPLSIPKKDRKEEKRGWAVKKK
jgi:hypothetical protein